MENSLIKGTFPLDSFKVFKSDIRIGNIKDYVLKMKKDNSSKDGDNGIKIIVGCDSQNRRSKTHYTTVIILVYPDKKGAHVLEHRETVKRFPDVFVRLHEEVRRSLELAEVLGGTEIVDAIHCDYNSEKSAKSYQNYEAGLGWAISMGYKAFGKPFAFGASTVADYSC